ncbi:MAG: hypothetical protein K0Q79_44 [Flavipsychrobacter sp.]|jgi:hypothetical protein|nr:hypothetical protein [Flavipsychrobacter sp.]
MKGKGRNEATRALNNRSALFSEEPFVVNLKKSKSTKKSHAIYKQQFAGNWETVEANETAIKSKS